MTAKPRGRPKKYAEYDALVASLPRLMAKRPKYLNGIGVFRGAKSQTAWVKIRLTHGGLFKGRSYAKGAAAEIKLGNLSSWSWKELEAKHDELQGKADRAEPLEDEAPQLFSECATGWLERLKKRTRGYQTAEVHLNAHLLKAFGKKTLDAIRVGDFNSYISQRLSDAKASTVKREVDTLNAILNDAVKSGHLEANPGRHADKIKGITPRQRFLDAEEVVRLLTKAEEIADWLPDFILWCLHSGMRRGEVLWLLWSDVRKLPNDRQIMYVEHMDASFLDPRARAGHPTTPRIIKPGRTRAEEHRQSWELSHEIPPRKHVLSLEDVGRRSPRP